MRPSTPYPNNGVLPSRPPTNNTLPAEQRARLIHSTRKVGEVLGTTPRLVDDHDVNDDELRISKVTKPRKIRPPPLSHRALFTPLSPLEELLSPKTPIPITRRRQKRRKMAKLQRILGEAVDPCLVFPNSPVTPRESFASSSSTLVNDLEPSTRSKEKRYLLAPLLPEISLGAPLLVIEQDDPGNQSGCKDESADGEITPSGKRPATKLVLPSSEPMYRPSMRTSSRLPNGMPSKVTDEKGMVTTSIAAPTSHRHSKSAVDSRHPHSDGLLQPPARTSFDEAKRRKSKHRSTSIHLSPEAQTGDCSKIKFAIEGSWNRDDIEEVRKALRDLRAT